MGFQSRFSADTACLDARDRDRADRLLGHWDDLYDRRTGIIRDVFEMPCDDDDPALFHMLTRSCDTSAFTTLRNFGNNGGASINRYVALAKAVGEGIERYCSAIFDYDDLLYARYADIDQPATDPEAYALYSPPQYAAGDLPWKPFTADSLVAWTRGRALADGRPVLVPASMVYVPYHFMSARGDVPIIQPISTGLALGSSFEDAALSALCEVIERDAFTITWQAQLTRPRIDASSLPSVARELLARFADARIAVEMVDITNDIGVPTLMTIAISEAETSPAIAVAAATHPAADVALIKSLEELAHTRKYAKQLMEYTPEVPFEPEKGHPAVADQKDHLRFYCPQAARAHIAFAHASSETIPLGAVQSVAGTGDSQHLAEVVRALTDAGLDPVACDLTTPDIAELGLRVVRAVVPGMHPLFMGHANRALGGRRLYEVPGRLGYPAPPIGGPDNPFPHPFP